MFRARGTRSEVAERTRGMGFGGLGALHTLAGKVGLVDAIDQRLHLLKVHLPYPESDHVLNLAYNLLAGGQCLEDLEHLRNDEVYLDAPGTQRIPDPTTAGDFCRRFESKDIEHLLEAIWVGRRNVWAQQPDGCFLCIGAKNMRAAVRYPRTRENRRTWSDATRSSSKSSRSRAR